MSSLFAEEKINTGRQYETDLARGFMAIIMVFCHVVLFMGNQISTGLYTFFDIIASEPGAPVFMTLLGVNIVYSKKSNPRDLLARGIKIFLAGYALNLYRSLIPYLLLGSVNEFASGRGFFLVDIMQLAGLSFIFIAFLKKYKVPATWVLLIALLLTYINQWLMFPQGLVKNNFALSVLVDLFCPVSSGSCFPLLTWFFFPALGLWFGEFLIRCRDKDKLYGVLLPISLAGVVYVWYQFYCLYPDYAGYYFGNNYYYMGVKNVLLAAAFVSFALSFWYFAGKILPDFLHRFLIFFSVHLTAVFFVSWMIIALLIHAQSVCGWQLNDLTIMSVAAGVMLLTVMITEKL